MAYLLFYLFYLNLVINSVFSTTHQSDDNNEEDNNIAVLNPVVSVKHFSYWSYQQAYLKLNKGHHKVKIHSQSQSKTCEYVSIFQCCTDEHNNYNCEVRRDFSSSTSDDEFKKTRPDEVSTETFTSPAATTDVPVEEPTTLSAEPSATTSADASLEGSAEGSGDSDKETDDEFDEDYYYNNFFDDTLEHTVGKETEKPPGREDFFFSKI